MGGPGGGGGRFGPHREYRRAYDTPGGWVGLRRRHQKGPTTSGAVIMFGENQPGLPGLAFSRPKNQTDWAFLKHLLASKFFRFYYAVGSWYAF